MLARRELALSTSFDAETDCIRISFRHAESQLETAVEIADHSVENGHIGLSFDQHGALLGIEIHGASKVLGEWLATNIT